MKLPDHKFGIKTGRLAKRRGVLAFTLIEVLIALSIFALIITGIYSSWSGIHRATRIGLEAAADAQRKRVAMRALEQSLGSVKYFLANETNYTFIAEGRGDSTYLSFVAHLPETFPRSALFEYQPMRRVNFSVEPGTNGLGRLVLRQQPFLFEANVDDSENPLVLANDVVAFNVKFLPDGADEWEEEWLYTNELPVMAHVTLSFRHGESVYENHKLIALASSAVPAEFQLGVAGRGGARGQGAQPGQGRGDPRDAGARGRGDGPRYPSGNMFNRPGGNSRNSSGNRRGPNGNFGDSRDRGGSRGGGGGSRGGGGGSGGGGRP
ncbi:MAG TPA: prepilin-type N-terminal cleavage/methylation domain-containing protein [Verrucomicrobia bacterium]|nr:prepilin-type N-terminal cleavage/methylation domain-containing protein [Verrucomicrobiota bacterium]